MPGSDASRGPQTSRIRRAIMDEEARLRSTHAWLAHQDAIGLGVFVLSLAVIGAAAWLYVAGIAAGWGVMLVIALALSLLHELEHDLIHDQYFRHRPGMQGMMFAVIFAAKMSMDPWARREIHRRHHRVSGQPVDIEERLIGLGEPLGLRRLLITVLPVFTVLVWPDIHRALRADAGSGRARRPSNPKPLWRTLLGLISVGFALLPLVVFPAAILGHSWAIGALVLYVGPNTIRHASIAFVSSSSHYYEDIPRGAIGYQNQILDHWMLWPLQMFCFNFGATHILHHYVVQQPFYIRQLVSARVRPVLLEEGVRHNDLGTFRRANRWRMSA